MITPPSSITEWDGPPIQAAVCSAAEGYSIARAFDANNGLARVLRASKMVTKQDLLNEFGAALQFGDYFGENWDAFDECINDLDWIAAPAYLLVIVDADRLLSAGPDRDLAIFLDILSSASAAWENPEAFPGFDGRDPRPFHVLLQVAPDAVDDFEALRTRSELPLPFVDIREFITQLEELREEAVRASREARAAPDQDARSN